MMICFQIYLGNRFQMYCLPRSRELGIYIRLRWPISYQCLFAFLLQAFCWGRSAKQIILQQMVTWITLRCGVVPKDCLHFRFSGGRGQGKEWLPEPQKL